MLVIDEKLRQV